MKKIVSIMIAAFMLSQANARSIITDYDVLKAEMKVLNSSGIFGKSKKIILSKRSVLTTTGRELQYRLTIDGVVANFKIDKEIHETCGSKTYRLVKIENDPNANLVFDLTDHTTRTCRDMQPYRWVAQITHEPKYHHLPISHLKAGGNPLAVETLDKEIVRFDSVLGSGHFFLTKKARLLSKYIALEGGGYQRIFTVETDDNKKMTFSISAEKVQSAAITEYTLTRYPAIFGIDSLNAKLMVTKQTEGLLYEMNIHYFHPAKQGTLELKGGQK